MSSKKTSKEDLLHDFQSELHAILNTVELVQENLHLDKAYCEAAMAVAGPRADIVREKWKQLRERFQLEKSLAS